MTERHMNGTVRADTWTPPKGGLVHLHEPCIPNEWITRAQSPIKLRLTMLAHKVIGSILRNDVCNCKMGWENDTYHWCTCNPKRQMKVLDQEPQHWNCKPCQIVRKKSEDKLL